MKYVRTLALCLSIIAVVACSSSEPVESRSSVTLSEVTISSATWAETVLPKRQLARLEIAEHSAVFSVGSFEFTLEVASSPSELERGLMGRTYLGDTEGMLFVFDREELWALWMKDTHIDLDAVWIDSSGTVVHVETMLVELGVMDSQLSIYSPTVPCLYAIELKAGLATRVGLTPGIQVTIHSSR